MNGLSISHAAILTHYLIHSVEKRDGGWEIGKQDRGLLASLNLVILGNDVILEFKSDKTAKDDKNTNRFKHFASAWRAIPNTKPYPSESRQFPIVP